MSGGNSYKYRPEVQARRLAERVGRDVEDAHHERTDAKFEHAAVRERNGVVAAGGNWPLLLGNWLAKRGHDRRALLLTQARLVVVDGRDGRARRRRLDVL